jgi:hypothetical protein
VARFSAASAIAILKRNRPRRVKSSEKFFARHPALISRSAVHAARILQILDLRSADDTGLRHRITQLVGVHEFARFFDRSPIQQQGDIAGVLRIVKQPETGFSGTLACIQMGIECFLPAVVIRNLVADKNMYHDALQKIPIQDNEIYGEK